VASLRIRRLPEPIPELRFILMSWSATPTLRHSPQLEVTDHLADAVDTLDSILSSALPQQSA
jgi:hypothetical protein